MQHKPWFFVVLILLFSNFSLFSARVKHQTYKSLPNAYRAYHSSFWLKLGCECKKKVTIPKDHTPAVSNEERLAESTVLTSSRTQSIEEGIEKSLETEVCQRKISEIARRSDRIATQEIKHCIFYPCCTYKTANKEFYNRHMLCDHQINENGELIGDNKNWDRSINCRFKKRS